MDKELLVEEQIDDGRRLIIELLRADFDVTGAFWVRTGEDGLWLFYISSTAVDVKKVGGAYRQVYACLNNLSSPWIAPSDIKLIHPSNPVSVAAVMIRDRHPGRLPTRYHGKRLGPLAIEEAYIYPQERWFKGFDEIKQQFPSAEFFAVPILGKDVFNPVTRELNGRVNAATFEGRAPGTVIFLGPKGGSGQALGELGFVHRPEGWNTLFRTDTKSWEEVVYVGSGKKLYESADFGPLAALKTDQKPAARELEMIKKRMEEGNYCLLIPGNPNPIRSIPYTPPPRPGEAPQAVIDWEEIRRIMEAGGTIEVLPIPKGEMAPK